MAKKRLTKKAKKAVKKTSKKVESTRVRQLRELALMLCTEATDTYKKAKYPDLEKQMKRWHNASPKMRAAMKAVERHKPCETPFIKRIVSVMLEEPWPGNLNYGRTTIGEEHFAKFVTVVITEDADGYDYPVGSTQMVTRNNSHNPFRSLLSVRGATDSDELSACKCASRPALLKEISEFVAKLPEKALEKHFGALLDAAKFIEKFRKSKAKK